MKIGPGLPLAVIAGPCVIETPSILARSAEKLAGICAKLGLPLILKSSYDKANRSAAGSYRGPGLESGLALLRKTARDLDLPCTTDVHSPDEALRAADYVDLIQIPAFLCRQSDLLVAAGSTGKPVNVKKGQFMSPEAMAGALDKVREGGSGGLMVTERGSSFGYGDLVVDFRSFAVMSRFGCPLVFDGTHSLQRPPAGAQAGISGGQRGFAGPLWKAAAVSGIQALFFECHPDPKTALSDAATQIPLKDVESLLAPAAALHKAARRME